MRPLAAREGADKKIKARPIMNVYMRGVSNIKATCAHNYTGHHLGQCLSKRVLCKTRVPGEK